MSFKTGQQVICIRTQSWIYRETRIDAFGPDNNQVCTVIETSQDDYGTYIRIKGFEEHGNYNSTSFRPLEYGKQAISDLTKAFKEGIETIDQPIKKRKGIKI